MLERRIFVLYVCSVILRNSNRRAIGLLKGSYVFNFEHWEGCQLFHALPAMLKNHMFSSLPLVQNPSNRFFHMSYMVTAIIIAFNVVSRVSIMPFYTVNSMPCEFLFRPDVWAVSSPDYCSSGL